jgi:hypothetical protein
MGRIQRLLFLEMWQAITRVLHGIYISIIRVEELPLWSNGQCSWLLTHWSRVLFPALPDFLSSNGSGRGPLSLVRINEELLEKESNGSGLEN